MPAHTHIAASRGGVPFDLEPHLPMVERPAQPLVLSIEEEDDMQFRGSELKTLTGAAPFSLEVGSNFRADRSTTSAVLATFPAGTAIYPAVSIDGQAIGDNDQWAPCFMWTGTAYEWGYFHTSVVKAPAPAGVADCSAEQATIAALNSRIARASTANGGAMQAQQAVKAALG
jgi:hypothetical protein